jgi:hypothetical protein
MKDLIGKKVIGFRFDSHAYKCGYSKEMDELIGETGVINKYHSLSNCYTVQFKGEYWNYPAELIEQHLIEENSDEIDRDVLRRELEKFGNFYRSENAKRSIYTEGGGFIDDYFEYLDKEDEPTKEITLQEIADKFNVPVDKIRIKE